MNITPEEYISRLNEILQKKQSLLQDILVLTEKQAPAINEDEIDELNKLIDEKQVKIDDINKLDDQFNVYFQRLKTSMKIASLSELDATGLKGAKQLKEITAEILRLITEISGIEQKNNKKGKELLDNLGEEIRKINQSKKCNSAYSAYTPNTSSYFIDKKK